jgi:hypothetical protein
MNRRRAMMRRASRGFALPAATAAELFTLPISPAGIVVVDGNLWVAGFNGGGIRKYDGISANLLDQTDTAGDYRGIGFDGTHILAAEFDDDLIYRVDVADPSRLSSFAFNGPRDLCVVAGMLVISDQTNVLVYAGADTTTLLQTHPKATWGMSGNVRAIGTDGVNVMIGDDDGVTVLVDGASLATASPVVLTSFTITAYAPSGFAHDGTNWLGSTRSGSDSVFRHDNI